MLVEREVVIFYSWQSDLPKETNLQAIRTALRSASSNVEADLSGDNFSIRVEEATTRTPGSRNIPAEILRKIAASDIFVCDVTPIYTTSEGHPKSSANPNVIFELGFAVAQLGWDRVILLFNESFGHLPNDLPFDFDRHRATPYKLAKASAPKRRAYEPLVAVLTKAIAETIKADPKKPLELAPLTPEQIRRQRDIKNLRSLLEEVHWPTLEQHIADAPKVIHGRIFHFYEGFHAVRKSHLFHIYDEELRKRIDAIDRSWSQSIDYAARYEHAQGEINRYFFVVPVHRLLTEQEEKDWKAIEKSLNDLQRSISEFLQYLRTNYLEIDIDELSQTAWKRYVEFYEAPGEKIDAIDGG